MGEYNDVFTNNKAEIEMVRGILFVKLKKELLGFPLRFSTCFFIVPDMQDSDYRSRYCR